MKKTKPNLRFVTIHGRTIYIDDTSASKKYVQLLKSLTPKEAKAWWQFPIPHDWWTNENHEGNWLESVDYLKRFMNEYKVAGNLKNLKTIQNL